VKSNRPQNSVARKKKRKRDEKEEEEDVEEEDMLILSKNQRVSNIRRPCKRCSKISLPGNYGFCSFHRIPIRKSPSTATLGVRIYDALPATMSTRARYHNFLSAAQQRAKTVHITMHRWLLLSCSPCAYCSRRGADVINGVDRVVDNEAHYSDNSSVPCCFKKRVRCHCEGGWIGRDARIRNRRRRTSQVS